MLLHLLFLLLLRCMSSCFLHVLFVVPPLLLLLLLLLLLAFSFCLLIGFLLLFFLFLLVLLLVLVVLFVTRVRLALNVLGALAVGLVPLALCVQLMFIPRLSCSPCSSHVSCACCFSCSS